MSEELAQGLFVAARVGFERATFGTQGTERTTEPPRPTIFFTRYFRVLKTNQTVNRARYSSRFT